MDQSLNVFLGEEQLDSAIHSPSALEITCFCCKTHSRGLANRKEDEDEDEDESSIELFRLLLPSQNSTNLSCLHFATSERSLGIIFMSVWYALYSQSD